MFTKTIKSQESHRQTMSQASPHARSVLNFGVEYHHFSRRRGQKGNVYQPAYPTKWNPQAPAYGRFWVDVPENERRRKTISLGICPTKYVARQRLLEFIERAGINSKNVFHQNTAPAILFRQQAEWWIESLSTRRRRPLKPATVFGWQHCLDKWILPNLGNRLLSEVGNGALRHFVEILSVAGLAPKTIINVVVVVKMVVASAVNEEGDQIYPRAWNHEFIQLPLIVKEKQNRPTITQAEISAVLGNAKKRYAVLFALVAGTGLRIGEALAVRTTDFEPGCHVLHIQRSVWPGCEQEPKTASAIRPVDIPEALAQVLCRYTASLDGPLFTSLKGKLLDQRSALNELHATGKRGGFHTFRRFRFAVLRKARVPDHLIKLWMGHSQNLIDRYPAQLDVDITYRREWCEKTGLGFELGELGYKDLFPIRPQRVA